MNPQPLQTWRGRDGRDYLVVARTPGWVEIEGEGWIPLKQFSERMECRA